MQALWRWPVRLSSVAGAPDQIVIRKVPRKIWLLVLMVMVGVLPLVSVAIAGLIADLNGCGLHEGFVQPCIMLGADIGGLLYNMVAFGWLMLISLFFFAGGLLGLLVEGSALLIRMIRRV